VAGLGEGLEEGLETAVGLVVHRPRKEVVKSHMETEMERIDSAHCSEVHMDLLVVVVCCQLQVAERFETVDQGVDCIVVLKVLEHIYLKEAGPMAVHCTVIGLGE
jgi:hypothetical protein